MDYKKYNTNTVLIAASILLLYVPMIILVQSAVMVYIWNLFLPHLGIAEITMPLAMGISLLISVMNPNKFESDVTKKDGDISTALLRPMIFYLFTVLFAYIVHLFI